MSLCLFPLDPKIHPSSLAHNPASLFASVIVTDTSGLVRFVNVDDIGIVVSSSHTNMRLLRGKIELLISKKWIPWLWEATGYLLDNDRYYWNAVVLHTDGEKDGYFTEDRLHAIASKLDSGEDLSCIERVAYFMVGCLTNFANGNQKLLTNGMQSAHTKHTEAIPDTRPPYKQCPICMLSPPLSTSPPNEQF